MNEADSLSGPRISNVANLALRPTTIRDIAAQVVQQQTPGAEQQYPRDVEEFYRAVFGMQLPDFQVAMLNTVIEHKYTAITTCTSIGKTMALSRLVLYWLHTFPNSIVVTTGPSGRQVRYVMWANVRAAADSAKLPLMGEAFVDRYQIGPQWFGYGFKASKENISALQGFHADNFLVIVDEATGVPNDIIDVLRNTLIHPGARFVMLSNPVSTAGRLYEAFHGDQGAWATIQLGFQDTPNFTAAPPEFLEGVRAYLRGTASFPLELATGITPEAFPFAYPGMINWPWVLDQIRMFGEDSAFVQARIWGRFVSEEDVLIPLALIDRAKNWSKEEVVATAPYEAGLDVGRFGKDKSVLVVREGPRVVGVYSWQHKTTTETARLALRYLEQNHPYTARLKVDEIGVGGGVVDYMRERVKEGSAGLKLRVLGVNVSEKSSNKERWRNQRQEGFNFLATLFRRGHIAIGPDEHLAWPDFSFSWPTEADAELSDLRYKFDDHTEPVVENKDQFRERRGRSPDYADALMLAFFNPKAPRDPEKTGIISQGRANVYRRQAPRSTRAPYKKAGRTWRRTP